MKNDLFGVRAQVDVKKGLGKSKVRVQTWGSAGEWWLEQAAGRFRMTIEATAQLQSQSVSSAPLSFGTPQDPLDLSGWRDDILADSFDPDPWDFESVVDTSSAGTSPVAQSAILSIEQTLAASPIQGRWRSLGGPGVGTHSHTSSPHNWQSDNAIDMKVPEGTPVRAIADGVISTSYGYGPSGSSGRFAGSRLHLELPDGDVAYYAHLNRLAAKPGQTVKEGDIIGYSGSASGVPHLHFATKKTDPVVWAEKGRAK